MRRASLLSATAAFAATLAGFAALAAPGGAKLELKASRDGFSPPNVTLRKGETAHVVLTSDDVEHCFAIDELRIEKRIVPGRATRFDLAADRAGTYAIYCCLEHGGPGAGKERGTLTVVE